MGDMAVGGLPEVTALIIEEVTVPDQRQRLRALLLLMRLRQFRARRILKASDGIVHFDAPLLPHHLKTVDVRVFVVAVHPRDKGSDSPAFKLEAEGRGR